MNKNSIKLGSIISYISIGLNIIAGLLYLPWMVNSIGESDYGLFTLAMSLINLFLIDFGLSAATTRYISKCLAENDQLGANKFVTAISKLYAIIDLIIFALLTIVYFLIDSIYVRLNPVELEKFKMVYLLAASYAVVSFPFVTLNGILTSYEKFIHVKIADIIYRVLSVLLTVITLLCGGGLYTLVFSNSISGLVIIVYKLLIIKRYTPIKLEIRKTDKGLYRDIFSFSFWSTITTLASRLIFSIVPSILAVTTGSRSIAIFGIITTIEGYTFSISSAINGMFMPEIARIYSGDDAQDKITKLMTRVGRFQLFVNGLIVVGFIILGREFIVLWMGNEYSSAYLGILLIIIPSLFYNTLQIGVSSLIMQKKVKMQALITLIMGLINVLLAFVFSYYFGVIGATVSIFCAFVFRALAYNFVLKKTLKLNMSYFNVNCYVKAIIPTFITILIGLSSNFLISVHGWLAIAIKGIFVVLLFFILMYLFFFEKYEKDFIKRFFKKS